jgi:hypothetical protein
VTGRRKRRDEVEVETADRHLSGTVREIKAFRCCGSTYPTGSCLDIWRLICIVLSSQKGQDWLDKARSEVRGYEEIR